MALNAFGIIDENEPQGIYAFGSHQYALYFWAKAVHEGRIPWGATLLHIDFHTDFLAPSKRLRPTTTKDQIDSLIKSREIRNDNFIKAAMNIGIVKDVLFCCKPRSGEFNDCGEFTNFTSPLRLVNLLQMHKEGDLLSQSDKILCNLISQNNLILDLDLDFFVDFTDGPIVLKDDALIIQETQAINDIFQHSKIMTICTSHDWSWDDKQRLHATSIFCKHFTGRISLNSEPEQIYGLKY